MRLGFGILGYLLAYGSGQMFREGLFQFMTSFSLPFYAIVGAQAGVTAGLPIAGVLFLAVVGPTAGRWYVDVSSGVPPKQFIKGEWFVTTALGTGVIWLICDAIGLGTWVCVGIAFVFGYTFRVLALYRAWEEPLAREPKGVYQHDDGRPMLGRKIKGKSVRESCATSACSSRTAPTAPRSAIERNAPLRDRHNFEPKGARVMAKQAEKPNIILFMSDDVGWGDAGLLWGW